MKHPATATATDIVPFGDGDIDFQNFFKNMGAKGFHNPNYEQDNAPGGGTDPGRSLRHAVISVAQHDQR